MKKNIIKFILNLLFMHVILYVGGRFLWTFFSIVEIVVLVMFYLATGFVPDMRGGDFRERYIITLVVYLCSIALSSIGVFISFI